MALFKVLRGTLDSQLHPMLTTLAAYGSGSSSICDAARDKFSAFWQKDAQQLLSKAASHEQSSTSLVQRAAQQAGLSSQPSDVQCTASDAEIHLEVRHS